MRCGSSKAPNRWTMVWTFVGESLDPNSIDRHQGSKDLNLLRLRTVVVLLCKDRNQGSATTYDGVVRSQIPAEADTRNPYDNPPTAELAEQGRGNRHDCGRWFQLHAADPTNEAPTDS